MPKSLGAEVFSYISPELQETLVQLLSDKEIAFIIEDMYTDDAVDFIDELPANVVEKVLRNSTEETRTLINKLLGYEDYTAGSIMTTEFMDFKSGKKIKKACKNQNNVYNKDYEMCECLYRHTLESTSV